jgi:hypothetical protein
LGLHEEGRIAVIKATQEFTSYYLYNTWIGTAIVS